MYITAFDADETANVCLKGVLDNGWKWMGWDGIGMG
jgi:hypothetical protein